MAWLLEPFVKNGYYDVDTSDTLGILLACLKHGQRDPLQRARIEIADLGMPGVEAARRVIDAAWNNPDRFNDIRNALDVLAYSREPAAADVIAHVLEHEAPTPRQAAIQTLRQHPAPRFYDLAMGLLETESPEMRPQLVSLLFALDAPRAARDLLEWMAAGRDPELWADATPSILAANDALADRRCCDLLTRLEPPLSVLLAAACARSGNAESKALLSEWQQSDKPAKRQVAVEALASCGALSELKWTLERDPEERLRTRAVVAFASADPIDPWIPLLEAALSDASDAVSGAALRALVQHGHREAQDRALQDLDSEDTSRLDEAVLTLLPLWSKDEALARRALARLMARARDESELSGERRRPVLRALGLLPLEEAGQYLLSESRRVQGTAGGMPIDRWLILQVGNGGEVGQRLLARELAQETLPVRRIDLIEALSAQPTETARAALLARADEDGVPSLEMLYLADRLTRLGPSSRVAPVLKRAALRVTDNDVKRALQGLLWMWYPAPEPH